MTSSRVIISVFFCFKNETALFAPRVSNVVCWPRLQRACAHVFVVTVSCAARRSQMVISVGPEAAGGSLSCCVNLCCGKTAHPCRLMTSSRHVWASASVTQQPAERPAVQRSSDLHPPPRHRILFAAISAAWIITFCASVTSAKCRFCWPLKRSDSGPIAFGPFTSLVCSVSFVRLSSFLFFYSLSQQHETCWQQLTYCSTFGMSF